MSANLDITVPSTLPSNEELVEQVDRILRSQQFSGSEMLRSLLSFLCSSAIEGRAEPLRVREIATAVFGRSEDFDSQTDSVVRVHTGRLRSKLAEYYMNEGSEDDLILTIPKGGYAFLCHYRSSASTPPPTPTRPPIIAEPSSTRETPRVKHSIKFAIASLLLLLAIAATWFSARLARERAQVLPRSLQTFWAGFISSETPCLIVFSNFRFIELQDGSLQPYDGQNDPRRSIIDTYTTMGEVTGVFETGRVLSLLHQSPVVKRGRLLTWDEARDSNLIFVGGPLAHTPLRDVPILKDFRFIERTPTAAAALANLHPQRGEQSVYPGPGPYAAIHSTRSSFDYAVVALRPGLTANHRILTLAGITEYGTEGAAEFVTRREYLEKLLRALRVAPGGTMPWFESLVRVQVQDGVPIQSDLVVVHRQTN